MTPETDFESIFQYWCDNPGGIGDKVESKLLASIYRATADSAIENDELFMAEELAKLGCKHAQNCGEATTPFYQMQALALARSGSVKKAYHLLLRLSSVAKDPESVGLLARTFRDIGWAEADPVRRKNYFMEAFSYVSESYARSKNNAAPDRDANYYNAIQAAQFAFFADQGTQVQFLADAENECLLEETRGDTDPKKTFWRAITRAEIELLRGKDLKRTVELYAIAKQMSEPRYSAHLRACWIVAKEILKHRCPPGWEELLEQFHGPSQVIFSGHQFDSSPGQERFPADSASEIRKKMISKLRQLQPGRVFCSHSFGADLLFLEAALELNIPITLVLAFDLDRAAADYRTAVSKWSNAFPNVDPAAWIQRSEQVLHAIECGFSPDQRKDFPSLASRHQIHQIEFPLPNQPDWDPSIAYDYTNRIMTGLALLNGKRSDCETTLMAVLNNEFTGEQGGTADFLQQVSARPIPGHELLSGSSFITSPTSSLPPLEQPANGNSIEIRFCVFIDVVGFEGISDSGMKAFLNEFLATAAKEIETDDTVPRFTNTWGDAILLVYESAEHAGRAALKLQKLVRETPFQMDGKVHQLNLRIGIHGGPMLHGKDPFTKRDTFLGKNINRAARIEPIAEEGQIFVSQEFAALSEVEGVNSYRCVPQGLADLPKNSGRIRVYRLVPSEE